MWRAVKWRETAHRIRQIAKRVHEDDENLEVLLSLADDCDAQADQVEKVTKKKVEEDITRYAATSKAHHHRHRRRRSTRRRAR